MKKDLEDLRELTISSISMASSEKELNEIRVRVLGRKGTLTGLLKTLPSLPAEQRREIGKIANQIKEELEEKIKDFLNTKYWKTISFFVYDLEALRKISNWYVFELASDSLIVYDRGKVKKIFDKIIEKATKEWDLVRRKFGRHWCWMLGRPAKPGEILHFELTEDDVKFI